MGFTKATYAVDNITSLSSTPNATEGLTAAQLQAKFDKTGADGKTYVNNLVDELDISSGEILTALSKFNSTELLTGKNLNDYKTSGIYYFDINTISSPLYNKKWHCIVLGNGVDSATQILMSDETTPIIYIRTIANNIIGQYSIVQTGYAYENLTNYWRNSWSSNGEASISKTGNIVTLALATKSGTDTAIAVLPAIYRTSAFVTFPANSSDGVAGYITVNTSGVVSCSSNLVGKNTFANASWAIS